MRIEEVAAFADRFATHNERIVIKFKNNTEIRGHFINNFRLEKKIDNLWNFVILRIDDVSNAKLIINGEDMINIKKIIIF